MMMECDDIAWSCPVVYETIFSTSVQLGGVSCRRVHAPKLQVVRRPFRSTTTRLARLDIRTVSSIRIPHSQEEQEKASCSTSNTHSHPVLPSA